MSDWIEWIWTEEKPYPETLDTRVIVKFVDGGESNPDAVTVGYWYLPGDDYSSFHPDAGDYGRIVAYRVIE